MRIEYHNFDGRGTRRTRVYDVRPSSQGYIPAVTDVPCPICPGGTVRRPSAKFVAGYRICDVCGRHFMINGSADKPSLLRVGRARSTKKDRHL